MGTRPKQQAGHKRGASPTVLVSQVPRINSPFSESRQPASDLRSTSAGAVPGNMRSHATTFSGRNDGILRTQREPAHLIPSVARHVLPQRCDRAASSRPPAAGVGRTPGKCNRIPGKKQPQRCARRTAKHPSTPARQAPPVRQPSHRRGGEPSNPTAKSKTQQPARSILKSRSVTTETLPRPLAMAGGQRPQGVHAPRSRAV